jgi:tetratricopeptide (TPR) repeat protein
MQDFCNIYEQRRKDLMSRVPQQVNADYKYTVYTTWEISTCMIESQDTEISRHALDLLCVFSYLHFDGITEDIFEKAYHHKADRRPPTLERARWIYDNKLTRWDPFLIREPLQLLSSFSLIRKGLDGKQYSMHPLVHSWVRERADITDQAEWPRATALILGLSCPWLHSTEDYSFQRFLLPHLVNCSKYFLIENELKKENIYSCWLDICHSFTRIYYSTGQQQAELHLKQINVEAQKRTIGHEHPDTLSSMNNLANSLNSQGRYQEAANLCEEVLAVQKRTLGHEHPDTLGSMNNLANSLHSQGRYQEAANLCEEALVVQKRTLGHEHPDTLISIDTLARNYMHLDRLKDTLQLSNEVLEMRHMVLGADHPDTLLSIYNLSVINYRLGSLDKAIRLGKQALESQIRILGADHPNTLDTAKDLEIYRSVKARGSPPLGDSPFEAGSGDLPLNSKSKNRFSLRSFVRRSRNIV